MAQPADNINVEEEASFDEGVGYTANPGDDPADNQFPHGFTGYFFTASFDGIGQPPAQGVPAHAYPDPLPSAFAIVHNTHAIGDAAMAFKDRSTGLFMDALSDALSAAAQTPFGNGKAPTAAYAMAAALLRHDVDVFAFAAELEAQLVAFDGITEYLVDLF